MATAINDGGSNESTAAVQSRSSSIERRREFVRRQEARRRTFHEQTSFRVFPLQSLAMKDYDDLMRVYRIAADDDARTKVGSGDYVHGRPTVESQSIAISDEKITNDEGQSKQQHTDDDGDCRSSSEESNSIDDAVAKEEGAKKEDLVLQQRSSLRDDNISSSSSSRCSASSTSALWSKEPRLFAMETTVGGKRRYISAHLGRFMDRYWKECNVDTRHYYELIKEDVPCRLYFGKYESAEYIEFILHTNTIASLIMYIYIYIFDLFYLLPRLIVYIILILHLYLLHFPPHSKIWNLSNDTIHNSRLR